MWVAFFQWKPNVLLFGACVCVHANMFSLIDMCCLLPSWFYILQTTCWCPYSHVWPSWYKLYWSREIIDSQPFITSYLSRHVGHMCFPCHSLGTTCGTLGVRHERELILKYQPVFVEPHRGLVAHGDMTFDEVLIDRKEVNGAMDVHIPGIKGALVATAFDTDGWCSHGQVVSVLGLIAGTCWTNYQSL